ncbi:MAG: AraC family ligand binding domain-containing protein [Cyanobacteria bacterium P01_A01_bin.37]
MDDKSQTKLNEYRSNDSKQIPFSQSLAPSKQYLEFYHYVPGIAEAMPNHSHDEYQICLSIGGADTEVYYRVIYHLLPVNSLSVVHPGEIHKVRQLEDRLWNSSQWIRISKVLAEDKQRG